MKTPRERIEPLDSTKTFAVLSAEQNAIPIDVTESFWSDLESHFGDFRGASLVSGHRFTENWPTWEIHPAGDELVVLVAGHAEFVLDLGEQESRVILDAPGQYVIVPKGIWHTANIAESAQMFFVTPGQGTENKPR